MNYSKLMTSVILAAATATANANSINCPVSVKVGTTLNVSATFTNQDCANKIEIEHSVLSVLGNSGTGTIGLQGPFVTPLVLNIPHAACKKVYYDPANPQWGFNIVVTKQGSETTAELPVIKSVPTTWAGTLIAVTAGGLDINNKLISAGICHVTVTK